MKTITLTIREDFLREAYSKACTEWKDKIKENIPDFKFTKLKDGDLVTLKDLSWMFRYDGGEIIQSPSRLSDHYFIVITTGLNVKETIWEGKASFKNEYDTILRDTTTNLVWFCNSKYNINL